MDDKWYQNKRSVTTIAVGLLCVVVIIYSLGGEERQYIRQLETSTDQGKRVEAVDRLGAIGSSSAWKGIARFTRDPDEAVAARCLSILGGSGWSGTVEKLADGLTDERDSVKAGAVGGLGRCPRKEVGKAILTTMEGYLKDPKAATPIRIAAAQSLGSLHTWDAMATLVAGMRDPDAEIRGRCGVAVSRMIGRDFGFNPNDPLEKREKLVGSLENSWQGMTKAHEDYMKRLEKNP